MHPHYFSGKEQTLIPSSGPPAMLSVADGAVLLSYQRMAGSTPGKYFVMIDAFL